MNGQLRSTKQPRITQLPITTSPWREGDERETTTKQQSRDAK